MKGATDKIYIKPCPVVLNFKKKKEKKARPHWRSSKVRARTNNIFAPFTHWHPSRNNKTVQNFFEKITAVTAGYSQADSLIYIQADSLIYN